MKDTVVGTDGGLGGLTESSAKVGIAFGATAAMVLFGAFLASGADADPGAELAAEGKVCAVAPASATICCAARAPMPGIRARRVTAVSSDNSSSCRWIKSRWSRCCWSSFRCSSVTVPLSASARSSGLHWMRASARSTICAGLDWPLPGRRGCAGRWRRTSRSLRWRA